jgi:hypothetical protein
MFNLVTILCVVIVILLCNPFDYILTFIFEGVVPKEEHSKDEGY